MQLVIHGPTPITCAIAPVDNGWLVSRQGRSHRTNEAGLAWALKHWRAQVDMTPAEHKRERQRCILAFDWRCPDNFSCRRGHKKDIAFVLCSNWEPCRVPVGQMSLFNPISHKPAWRHIGTGEVVESTQRPGLHVAVGAVCKRMAVHILRDMQHMMPGIPYWRIVSGEKGASGKKWLHQSAMQHHDLPACVFDEWGMFNPLARVRAS